MFRLADNVWCLMANAVRERFSLLKMDRVWQLNYADLAEAECDIAAYIVEFTTLPAALSIGQSAAQRPQMYRAAKEPIVVSEIS
jgi:hypothetical protein